MAKFIPVHTSKEKEVWINVDHIRSIWPNSDSTDCKAAMYMSGEMTLKVLEDVAQLVAKIEEGTTSE